MMRVFDVIAILCTALMTGNELAVSLFVNPALRKLDERTQAGTLKLFARSLGRAMPVWYALCLVLIGVEAFLRRHEPGEMLLLIAIGIWVAVIVWTILVLVPINNQVAALNPAALPVGWLSEHKKWDRLHRWRIVFLTAATACLTFAVL
jgi:uncharacterized membrane protein